MIIPDKKKAVTVILSKLGKPGSDLPVKPEEEINDQDASLKAIAEDVMQAFKAGSAHDLMVALKSFVANADQE